MRGQRWVPFAVAGAAVVLVAAVPVASAVLSADPPRRGDSLLAEPGASPSPSPSVSPSPAPSATPTPSPSPSLSVAPVRTATAVATSRPPRPRTTTPPAMSGDDYEHWYCRKSTKTTGATTLTMQYCRWPGADNDAFAVTIRYTGDRVVRTLKVDWDDGAKDPYTGPHQYSCADPKRPSTLYHGERVHELAPGRRTVVATVVLHRCWDPYGTPENPGDPYYEDTDNPETATVTLVLDEIADP